MLNHPSKTAVCILPRLKGLGGPVSFYNRLTTGLQNRGVDVLDDPLDPSCRVVLVVGGTRQVELLLQARRKGVRIVQRLNGMNWMHRRRKGPWKYFLKAELNNRLLSFTRRWLADCVVYQSHFARTWWRTVYKPAKSDGPVIYNGVDLNQFTPLGDERPPQDHFRLLLVEAHVSGGYEMGLQNAIHLAEWVNGSAPKPVELMVVGNVPAELQTRFQKETRANIHWGGVVARDQIPAIDRSAHLLFSSDLNAACPNSVIEALACGLPVISFATGSLPELIQAESGKTVPYGSNYWRLEPPDIGSLGAASLDILQDQARFRLNARKRALEAFDLEVMVQNYLDVLL